MRVLVTGATGFIGRRVAARLLLSGHTVTGTTRSPEGAKALEALGITAAVGDLLDPIEHWTPILRAASPDVVVHLAAEIATQRRARLLWDVDVEGTRRLVAACLDARGRWGFPQRFVLAGTVVVGDPKGAVLTESEALVPTTAYGRAKLEAERIVREASEGGLAPTIVRPSHVYGAGGWFANIVRDMRRGRFFVPGDGSNQWDLVHVDDVASAFLHVVDAGDATAARVYHVVDDTPISMRAFFDATAEALGVSRPRSVPRWLARLVAGAGPIAAAVRSARSSNARLRAETPWRPVWPDARLALSSVIAEINAAESNG
jgi:nucleoside-diphosphate-sugar epimerase